MAGRNFDPQERQAKRRRNDLIMKYIICVLLLIILVMALLLIRAVVIPGIEERTAQADSEENREFENLQALTEDRQDKDLSSAEEYEVQETIASADALAEQYDYEGAISLVQASEYYGESEKLQSALMDYEAERDSCFAWDPEEVTHIFFHTIIWDESKAFDGDQDAEGYNQYMVTMNEFSAIMQTMYEEGYVMVSMHDMCDIGEDGSVTRRAIYLPEGKKPFVLSQDDVSYYHYMGGDGFAEKLILDENGKVKNTYIEDDGTVSVGDYDLVPWIDTFVDSHPDFAYHGHKGTIALTGYEGVLGYRTDEVYRTREEDRLTSWQRDFLDSHPDFDWQSDVDAATEVADVMKANGWEFASHTWGHIDPLARGYDQTVQDTERWMENVAPIVGGSDIIIFAFGADIAGWEEYTSDNDYFNYLKAEGFDIFCTVDSNTYWVQFNGTSMRMGRRNIDGYRMFYNPGLLDDLFDVSQVWDSARPDSVADLDEAAGTSVMAQ